MFSAKRFLATLLIFSMLLTSTGVITFATSIENITEKSVVSSEETTGNNIEKEKQETEDNNMESEE